METLTKAQAANFKRKKRMIVMWDGAFKREAMHMANSMPNEIKEPARTLVEETGLTTWIITPKTVSTTRN